MLEIPLSANGRSGPVTHTTFVAVLAPPNSNELGLRLTFEVPQKQERGLRATHRTFHYGCLSPNSTAPFDLPALPC